MINYKHPDKNEKYYLMRGPSGYKTDIMNSEGRIILSCNGPYTIAEPMAERIVLCLKACMGKSLLGFDIDEY